MSRLLTLFLIIAAVSPPAVAAQESTTHLAKGDSIQITIKGPSGMRTWTGIVREVRNPRNCLFLLVRGHEGGLDNVAFSIDEEFSLERFAPDPGAIRINDLKAAGIECVEANPTVNEMYLNPEPDSATSRGA